VDHSDCGYGARLGLTWASLQSAVSYWQLARHVLNAFVRKCGEPFSMRFGGLSANG
jgi:hypothetical protein